MTTLYSRAIVDVSASAMRDIQQINESLFPPRAFTLSRRVLIALVVLVSSFLFTGLFLYQAHAQSLESLSDIRKIMSVSPGKVYLGAQMPPTPATKSAHMLGINIANNGLVLLRGARITSISGETIYVEIKWNSTNLAWVVKTNLNTKFWTSAGEKQSLADMRGGDIVSVTGQLTENGTEPTIYAEFVRG